MMALTKPRKWIASIVATILMSLQLTQAWIPNAKRAFVTAPTATMLYSTKEKSTDNEVVYEVASNPCWEDLYDDDCAMSNVYSASFIAADWIKSMPCGANLEDCDMPPDLTVPDTRPEAGVEQVDVMDFLGLKRAAPIENKSDLKP